MFCDECGFENKDTAKFCKKCGSSLAEEIAAIINDNNSTNNANIESALATAEENVSLTSEEAIKYLEGAKTLEVNKMALENAINDLEDKKRKELDKIEDKKKLNKDYRTINYAQKVSYLGFTHLELDFFVEFFGVFAIIAFCIIYARKIGFWKALFFFFTGIGFFTRDLWSSVFQGILWPLGISAGLFILDFTYSFIRAFIENRIVDGQNKSITKLRESSRKATDEENKKIQEFNETIKEEKKQFDKAAEKEIDVSRNLLKETNKCLEKYYEKGPLYSKYRNIVAITTFLEYLQSKRCSALEGYTGCYNVYENELRQDVIIGKLDNVLDSLEKIKKGQVVTYYAIQESIGLQKAIVNNTNIIAGNTAQMAAELNSINAAQSSINSNLESLNATEKINQRNIEVMTTLTTLDYIDRHF